MGQCQGNDFLLTLPSDVRGYVVYERMTLCSIVNLRATCKHYRDCRVLQNWETKKLMKSVLSFPNWGRLRTKTWQGKEQLVYEYVLQGHALVSRRFVPDHLFAGYMEGRMVKEFLRVSRAFPVVRVFSLHEYSLTCRMGDENVLCNVLLQSDYPYSPPMILFESNNLYVPSCLTDCYDFVAGRLVVKQWRIFHTIEYLIGIVIHNLYSPDIGRR